MKTSVKVVAGCATIAAALVVAPKPSADISNVTPVRTSLTCYSNESTCDLINPTNETRAYNPCVTEDDPTPCYWDASTRGNGLGRSFVNTGREIVYVP